MAVPILWRNRRQRYNLEGETCPACARAVFPPREVCPYCSRQHSDAELANRERETQAQHEFGLHRNRYIRRDSECMETLESLWALPEFQAGVQWETAPAEENARDAKQVAVRVPVAGDD